MGSKTGLRIKEPHDIQFRLSPLYSIYLPLDYQRHFVLKTAEVAFIDEKFSTREESPCHARCKDKTLTPPKV